MASKSLLDGAPRVVNIGLRGFADELAAHRAEVVHVDWRPPAPGRRVLGELLARLGAQETAIAQANAEGLRRMLAADPVLVDVQPAGKVIPGLGERVVLHAGPPIGWERMCGPMRGAVAGAIVFEGWAGDLDAAARLAASGGVRFHPNHHFDAVGPMTGITTRSMPVMVVENRAKNINAGNRAYCMINEGLGKVMRFGANDAEVRARLAWLRDEFGPLFGAALRAAGGLELVPLVARGLTMGDEMHQRNVACSALTLRALSPHLARAAGDAETLSKSLAFIAGNEQFFLNIGMVMGKSIMDPVRDIEACSLVAAMCRNGTDFGVRVSGTGDAWFTAPVEMPQGLYFPGYSEADANPDMGDSAIMETIGLGAFAMASAPAVVGLCRRRPGERCRRLHARHGRHHPGEESALDHAGARLPGRALGHRPAPRGGVGRATGDQHRHRAPRARRRAGGRRRGACAARLLRLGARRLRAQPGDRGMSVVRNRLRRGFYADSVALMRIARALADGKGVLEASLMIGSPSNKALLEGSGLLADAARDAQADDLVIAVRARDARAGGSGARRGRAPARAAASPRPGARLRPPQTPRTPRAASPAFPPRSMRCPRPTWR